MFLGEYPNGAWQQSFEWRTNCNDARPHYIYSQSWWDHKHRWRWSNPIVNWGDGSSWRELPWWRLDFDGGSPWYAEKGGYFAFRPAFCKEFAGETGLKPFPSLVPGMWHDVWKYVEDHWEEWL